MNTQSKHDFYSLAGKDFGAFSRQNRSLTEDEVFHLAKANPEENFNLLVEVWRSRLENVVLKAFGPDSLVYYEDAVQESFLKIRRNIENFRGDSNPYTWMARIAVNTARDVRDYLQRRAAESLDAVYESEDGDSTLSKQIFDRSTHVDQVVIDKELLGVVSHLLSSLEAEARDCFVRVIDNRNMPIDLKSKVSPTDKTRAHRIKIQIGFWLYVGGHVHMEAFSDPSGENLIKREVDLTLLRASRKDYLSDDLANRSLAILYRNKGPQFLDSTNISLVFDRIEQTLTPHEQVLRKIAAYQKYHLPDVSCYVSWAQSMLNLRLGRVSEVISTYTPPRMENPSMPILPKWTQRPLTELAQNPDLLENP